MTDKKQAINEADHKEIIDSWFDYDALKNRSLDDFIKHLQNDYEHDYGTICHAIAAAGVQTMRHVNRGLQGGITGFKAGAVMWGVLRHWNHVDGPARILQYEDMLYPQYEYKFKTIDSETHKYLIKMANDRLVENEEHVHPNVRAHWQKVAAGIIPFGYTIEGENEIEPPPYARLVRECSDLEERLTALVGFIESDDFDEVPDEHKTLLKKQRGAMSVYLSTLQDRLKLKSDFK